MEIPGYKLGEKLGSGGMASVYRATQISLDRPVAIKIMREKLALTSDYTKRFLREARAVARLHHRHIVAVYDVGVVGDRHFYSMRLLEGGDLLSKSKEPGATIDSMLDALIAVADALHFSHESGLIHRDVKPSNILFDEDGIAYLADFGLVRDVNTTSALTAAGLSLGTSIYMSPEQITGESVSPLCDVYGLGVTAFEVIVGKPPFSGETSLAIAYQHVNQPLPELPDELSDWRRFFERSMAKRPHDRYETAGEAADALRAIRTARLAASGETSNLTPTPNVMEETLVIDSGEISAASDAYVKARESGAEPSVAAQAAISGQNNVPEIPSPDDEASAVAGSWLDRLRSEPKLAAAAGAVVVIVAAALLFGGGDDDEAKVAGDEAPIEAVDQAATQDTVDVTPEPVPIAEDDELEPAEPIDESGLAEATPPPLGEDETELDNPVASIDPEASTPVADELEADELEMGPTDAVAVVIGDEESVPGDSDAETAVESGDGAAADEEDENPLADFSIEQLLADAAVDITENRLTSPEGRNAYEKLIEVRDRDPENATAAELVERIVARYVGMSDAELNKGRGVANTRLVALYLDRADAVQPNDPRVVDLQRRAQQLSPRVSTTPGAVFRDTLENGGEGPEMVVIRSGRHVLDASDFPAAVTAETPFAIAVAEISVREFETFARANDYKVGGKEDKNCRAGNSIFSKRVSWQSPGFRQFANGPVVCVDADAAEAYVAWLSEQTGAEYRLPSEAEWLIAANGLVGAMTDPAGACAFGNVADESYSKAKGETKGAFPCDDDHVHPVTVGLYSESPAGAKNLVGNASEWLADCWNEDASEHPQDTAPWTEGDCRRRVIRGSSWRSEVSDEESYERNDEKTDAARNTIGFRVMRSLADQ